MFLDERLKAIYEEKISSDGIRLLSTTEQGVFEIMDACRGELPPPTEVRSYLIALKRVNNSYKLFKKQYDKVAILREDAFERYCWSIIKDNPKSRQFFKELGWKVPSDNK